MHSHHHCLLCSTVPSHGPHLPASFDSAPAAVRDFVVQVDRRAHMAWHYQTFSPTRPPPRADVAEAGRERVGVGEVAGEAPSESTWNTTRGRRKLHSAPDLDGLNGGAWPSR